MANLWRMYGWYLKLGSLHLVTTLRTNLSTGKNNAVPQNLGPVLILFD